MSKAVVIKTTSIMKQWQYDNYHCKAHLVEHNRMVNIDSMAEYLIYKQPELVETSVDALDDNRISSAEIVVMKKSDYLTLKKVLTEQNIRVILEDGKTVNLLDLI